MLSQAWLIKKSPIHWGFFLEECAGEDLNLHVLRHMALNHACLPIPAPALEQSTAYYNRVHIVVKQGIVDNKVDGRTDY